MPLSLLRRGCLKQQYPTLTQPHRLVKSKKVVKERSWFLCVGMLLQLDVLVVLCWIVFYKKVNVLNGNTKTTEKGE